MRRIDSVNRQDNINAFEALDDSGIVKGRPALLKLSGGVLLTEPFSKCLMLRCTFN